MYLRVNDEFHLLNISDILYRPLRSGVRTILIVISDFTCQIRYDPIDLLQCSKEVSAQCRPEW